MIKAKQSIVVRNKPQTLAILAPQDALNVLIPKFLGLLWKEGRIDYLGETSGFLTAHIGRMPSAVVIGGCQHRPRIYGFSVWIVEASGTRKTLEVAVIARNVTKADRYGAHIYKRGDWEDRVAAANIQPRTLGQLKSDGLAPSLRWHPLEGRVIIPSNDDNDALSREHYFVGGA